jgi:flagellar biosynthesis protein FlhA
MANRVASMGVPLLLVGIVMMMVVPMPPVLLDILLAANISMAVLVVLAVIGLDDSLKLSAFPSLLLIATMARLALNVSSTRLILLDGYAGKVIETFGSFVVGGSVLVGLVVFLILIVIQFAVITAGAGRVAEVGARFALDAMPGKQMAIDADLASGLIDEAEARRRRQRIATESDFYGAMDGASKFVKGDAIAGIVIVAINLVGGFAIGMVGQGMSLDQAVSTYALLTVGDGLVSQIPALLMSLSTGLLVSRVGEGDGDLGPQLVRQILGRPQPLLIAGVVLVGMAFVPGLPSPVFLGLGSALLIGSRRVNDVDADAIEVEVAEVATSPDDPEALIGRMRVEPLELHLAYDILDLIDPSRGGDLLERVRSLRQQIAFDLGFVMPLVRTRDDAGLPPATYRIMLHGVEVATGRAPADRVLALPAGDGTELRGMAVEETTEPVFGLQAFWVPVEARAMASATGSTVVDRSAVVVTHLAEVVRQHAPDLLSRQQVQQLLDGVRYDEPLLVNEVGSDHLPLALLHQVLRELLAERVPIRDLPRILEAVASRSRETQHVEQLAAVARAAVGSAILARVAADRRLAVVTLDPALEARCHDGLRDVDGQLHLVADPDLISRIGADVQEAVGRARQLDLPLAIVCGQMLRRPLRRALAATGIDVDVFAYPELPSHLELTQIGVIDHDPIPA